MSITQADIIAQFAKCGQKPPEQLLPKHAPKMPALAGNGDVLELSVLLDLRTVSEMNTFSGGPRARMRRVKAQRNSTRDALLKVSLALPPLPAVVTMTRIGKRLLDDDNLAASLKHVRDGVAGVYGVDDGDSRYSWEPRQEVGGMYAVRITVRPRRVP